MAAKEMAKAISAVLGVAFFFMANYLDIEFNFPFPAIP